MDFELVYPNVRKQSLFMLYFRYITGLTMLVASVVCVIVNYCIGGPAWSVVALWSMYMVWTLILKKPLVEWNPISVGVRLLWETVVLLFLIDRLIYPGWADFVVPIVGYGSLIVLAVLFFVNVSKQRHNVMPLVMMTVLIGAGSLIVLFVFSNRTWPVIALAVTAGVLLLATVFTLRMRLISELKKRFHLR